MPLGTCFSLLQPVLLICTSSLLAKGIPFLERLSTNVHTERISTPDIIIDHMWSMGKVMFSQASVILSTIGGGVGIWLEGEGACLVRGGVWSGGLPFFTIWQRGLLFSLFVRGVSHFSPFVRGGLSFFTICQRGSLLFLHLSRGLPFSVKCESPYGNVCLYVCQCVVCMHPTGMHTC